ncbi:D-lactate dehydrogenase [uncultured Cohaesibacter sp.]|uniref:D-lactate dehydrogenase n=1 Tax=uncultured Cohaesibacter sp. TaxID=1002546 RepID=UPI002930DA7C|nr:D-lactate dehydrogenase [uncultured Cohaesibacter sp.]
MQSNGDLITALTAIVGSSHIWTSQNAIRRFIRGYRSGSGNAFAVVQPGSLYEFWQCLKAAVEADKIIVIQAANTGLTEGSTPNGQYDRDVLLINTLRLNKLRLLNDAEQVLALPGATLLELEKRLARHDRLPHSVLGSTHVGATIIGGICNNSGGALVERGPAYTEQALFARITQEGTLELVNHLDIELGTTPREILTRLDDGDFNAIDILPSQRKASDTDYADHVRDIDADTPARFNADPRRLYEASGSAGKLAVFAVRLDTFPKHQLERSFYIGTNDPDALTKLRRVILASCETLPVFAEYMHKDTFDITRDYGKDTVILIDKLGTGCLQSLFKLKQWLETRPALRKLPDRIMQTLSALWPQALPNRIMDFRRNYEHHLLLRMHDEGVSEVEKLLERMKAEGHLNFFQCTEKEASIAALHRFATAAAAIRYQHLHEEEVESILALDVALPRNNENWHERLPKEIAAKLTHQLSYGHFMCLVMHHDYLVKKGESPEAIKKEILAILEQKGAEFPAEHNVGHLYEAKDALKAFYRQSDPTNSLNPGIGQMSRMKNYR